MKRKSDNVVAADTTAGAAAAALAWAVNEFSGVEIGLAEAGAFIVLVQSLVHLIADRFGVEDD